MNGSALFLLDPTHYLEQSRTEMGMRCFVMLCTKHEVWLQKPISSPPLRLAHTLFFTCRWGPPSPVVCQFGQKLQQGGQLLEEAGKGSLSTCQDWHAAGKEIPSGMWRTVSGPASWGGREMGFCSNCGITRCASYKAQQNASCPSLI